MIEEHDPDVVVSTYPGVTAVLGMLRENRRLEIPVQSAITDLAGLRYWAHPGVDLHYVTHPESIEEVERLVGPGTVEWVRPPISREFLMPRTRRDAREALDVPAHARMVLVSGGGWGIGDLEGAIETALSGDDTLVVCITGRNEVAREKLEQRFGDNEQVRILGFTEQMSDWMAAADAMIHATAGLTVLEAHIRGCPVVSYGFSAGHLRANNAAFERFGLAEVARSEHELESILRHVTRERRSPDSSFASLPSIASRVLTARPRVRPQPVWRLRVERVAAAVSLAGGRCRDDARRHPPRDALPGGREAAQEPHPLRQGRRRRRTPASPTQAVARSQSLAAARRPPPALDRAPPRRRRARRRGRRPRRAGAGAGRARAWARRSGSSCASRARTASRSPSTTARTRRGPRSCSRSCARRAPRRPSSSPASRSRGGRRWRRRSSPPATGSSCTATGTATSCGSRPRQLLDDAERGRAAIEEATGQEIHDYRPPYGIFSAVGLRAIRRRGWRPVLWSLWGRDWKRRATAESIAKRATNGAAAGDILLLHDADYYSAGGSWTRTAAALPAHTRRARRPGAEGRLAAR